MLKLIIFKAPQVRVKWFTDLFHRIFHSQQREQTNNTNNIANLHRDKSCFFSHLSRSTISNSSKASENIKLPLTDNVKQIINCNSESETESGIWMHGENLESDQIVAHTKNADNLHSDISFISEIHPDITSKKKYSISSSDSNYSINSYLSTASKSSKKANFPLTQNVLFMLREESLKPSDSLNNAEIKSLQRGMMRATI